MTEVTFSVPQNDTTTMARTSNLAFLLGHPIFEGKSRCKGNVERDTNSCNNNVMFQRHLPSFQWTNCYKPLVDSSYEQSVCLWSFVAHINPPAHLLLLFVQLTHRSLKAYCAILVRRPNFRHQVSPRASPRREHPAAESETVGEKCPIILPKWRLTRH
jgi:hypothetical protein